VLPRGKLRKRGVIDYFEAAVAVGKSRKLRLF
jgi:hypothetical protein